jgi:hypothetical protein
VEPAHYVFAAFTPKFTFSGKRVIDYNITGFDPSRHVNSWRSSWRTLTKRAALPGFRFHDLRHCAITSLPESGTADSTIMAIIEADKSRYGGLSDVFVHSTWFGGDYRQSGQNSKTGLLPDWRPTVRNPTETTPSRLF